MWTLYLRLFITYFKIGLFNFGGGYAMLPLIHHEIIEKNSWISDAEFSDIIAISQMTPGPIGINCATYVGYQAAHNCALSNGLDPFQIGGYMASIIGSFVATFAVCLPSFLLFLIIARVLFRYASNPYVKALFSGLRPAVIGLMLASALLLMDKDNFGFTLPEQLKSVLICVAVFIASWKYKVGPITLMLLAGACGLFLY